MDILLVIGGFVSGGFALLLVMAWLEPSVEHPRAAEQVARLRLVAARVVWLLGERSRRGIDAAGGRDPEPVGSGALAG